MTDFEKQAEEVIFKQTGSTDIIGFGGTSLSKAVAALLKTADANARRETWEKAMAIDWVNENVKTRLRAEAEKETKP